MNWSVIERFQSYESIPSDLIQAIIRRYDAEVFFMIGQLASDQSENDQEKSMIKLDFVRRYGQAIREGLYGRTRVTYSEQLLKSMDFRRWYFKELKGTMLQSIHGING